MWDSPHGEITASESLQRSWVQCLQRHQGSDRNVLVIHQLFLCEGESFHEGSCFVLALRVNQEDDAFAVAARIPLTDFPVEVELHSCLNLLWDDGHYLLRSYALPGSQNDQYFGCFRYSHAGYA